MKKIILSCVLFGFANMAYASNIGFLADSVISEFSEQELIEFKQFVGVSLETLADEEMVEWQSTTGSVKGQFKAKFTFQSGDKTCRRSLFNLFSSGQKDIFQIDICKTGDKWVIQRTPLRKFKKSDWDILKESLFSALDQPVIGTPFSWHNDKTGNSGSHVVVSQDNGQAQDCKQVAITVFNKKGQSSNGVYNFCKSHSADSDSEWERTPRLQEFQ